MAGGTTKIRKLRMGNDMTIYTAAETRSKLVDVMKKDFEIELDLSQVTDFDTAGLQLLIMVKRELVAGGGNLYLVNHSQLVYEVLDMCNMIPYFGDSIVLPSKQA